MACSSSTAATEPETTMDRIGDHAIEHPLGNGENTHHWRGAAPDGTPVAIRVLGSRDSASARDALAAVDARGRRLASIDSEARSFTRR